jgi:hypothetical protein
LIWEILLFLVLPPVVIAWAWNGLYGLFEDPLQMTFLLSPVIAMTVVVVVGIKVLKFWSLNTALSISRVVPHIGVVYLSLSAISFRLSINSYDGRPILFCLMMALVSAVIGCFYDYPLIKHGSLEVYTRAHYKQENVVKRILSYGPTFFALFGLSCGIAFQFAGLMAQNTSFSTITVVLTSSLIITIFMFFFLGVKQLQSYLKRRNRKIS